MGGALVTARRLASIPRRAHMACCQFGTIPPWLTCLPRSAYRPQIEKLTRGIGTAENPVEASVHASLGMFGTRYVLQMHRDTCLGSVKPGNEVNMFRGAVSEATGHCRQERLEDLLVLSVAPALGRGVGSPWRVLSRQFHVHEVLGVHSTQQGPFTVTRTGCG
jgi:hypothetical protein